MSQRKYDWTVPQKASPVALLFIIWKTIKDSWPILLILIGKKLFSTQEVTPKMNDYLIYNFLGFTTILLLINIRHIVLFFRFRVFVEHGELIVSSGIFSKTKTSIPINRIQSVHLIQTYLHRITNTCQLKVETAGTENTELEIKAIDLEKAQDLQVILQNTTHHTERIESDVNITGLHLKDVFKLAFSENHLKTFLIIVAFAFSRIEDLKQYLGINATDIIDEKVEHVQFTNTVLFQLIIVVLSLTLIVSFVRVLLRYYGMQIKSNSKGFQMQWGFLHTQQKMLIQNKVQLISWNSNFLRRIIGIHIFRFFMAGENIAKADQHIQLPIMHSELLFQLTAPYQPILPSNHSLAYKVDASYGWRETLFIGLPVTAAISIAIYFWNPLYIIISIMVLFYWAISNIINQRNYQFWYNAATIQIQKGVWGRENILLNFNKIQHLSIKTSPFLRARNIATIEIHTAGDTVTIPYIPIEQAQYLLDWSLFILEFEKAKNKIEVKAP
jgi:uncharacterized membrane protein YdbT with pleckstrin-like domain